MSTSWLVLLDTPTASAAPSNVEQWIEWETHGNAVSSRPSESFWLDHYEIPLRLLNWSFSEKLDPHIRQALLFEKDGETYVRWIIHPEDTKWFKVLRVFLRDNDLSVNVHHTLRGHYTASRSLVVENPEDNGFIFSLKTSTDSTGGAMLQDKKLTLDETLQTQKASDYIFDTIPRVPLRHLEFFEEPAAVGIKGEDQAFIVRSLALFSQGNRFYLPGFSALNDAVGVDIAKLNGSDNPEAFWREHYNRNLARALAEFAAYFGLAPDSPHSQNFLVELDAKMKPTGRIVIRDLGDSYALIDWFNAIEHLDFIHKWDPTFVSRGELKIEMGVQQGTPYPKWMSDEIYDQWGVDFFEAFEAKFSELTQIPMSELRPTQLQRNEAYFGKRYSTRSDAWEKHFNRARCLRGHTAQFDGTPCPKLPQNSDSSPCAKSLKTLIGGMH